MVSKKYKTFTLSEIKARRASYYLFWQDSMWPSNSGLGFVFVRDATSGELLGFSHRISFSTYCRL